MKAFFFTYMILPFKMIKPGNNLEFYVYCFALIFFSGILHSELVNSIQITGNQYTKDHIVLREIQHPVPGDFNQSVAQEDRDRIYNLGLFSTVDVSAQGSVYTVTVVETFRFIPFPLVEYDEGKGLSYGGGVAYKNFRGLNEKLFFGMIFGQERTWFLDFQDPWIAGDHVSINLGMYDFFSDGAVYAYEYHEKGGYAGIGFYQGDHNKYNVKMGVKTISVDTAGVIPDERWVLGTFIYDYHYLYTIFNYQYDTRDVFVDPTKGQHLKLHLTPIIGFENTHNYYQFNYEHTYFYQISQDFRNPVLSINSSLFIQKPERIPLFSYVYIGGEDYVRGYSPIPWQNPESTQDKIEGVHAFYESIQLQHTLIPRKDYGGIELGIDVVYFLDAGVSSNNLNSIDFKNGIVGYGFGLRFFASGAGVIGIDIGFNPYGTNFIHPTSVN